MERARLTTETDQVLVLAPVGRDARVASTIIAATGFKPRVCANLDEATQALETSLCLVVTQEALLGADRTVFARWLEDQPPWSDYPIVLLSTRGGELDTRLAFLEHNLIEIERPFSPSSLVSAVRSAARARRRQLQVKAYIEEHEEAEERQRLLIRELHHRVKNTLANVQALLGATARSQPDIESFTRAFSARIVSLSHTHTMLTEDYWQTATLDRILKQELQHYDTRRGRFDLCGPNVELVADIAVPFGMAIHELATNSAKYGALKCEEGRIEIAWRVTNGEEERVLSLDWRESNGPPVEPPRSKGFGSALLEKVLKVQCRAEIDVAYPREGFRMELTMPLKDNRLVPHYN